MFNKRPEVQFSRHQYPKDEFIKQRIMLEKNRAILVKKLGEAEVAKLDEKDILDIKTTLDAHQNFGVDVTFMVRRLGQGSFVRKTHHFSNTVMD